MKINYNRLQGRRQKASTRPRPWLGLEKESNLLLPVKVLVSLAVITEFGKLFHMLTALLVK